MVIIYRRDLLVSLPTQGPGGGAAWHPGRRVDAAFQPLSFFRYNIGVTLPAPLLLPGGPAQVLPGLGLPGETEQACKVDDSM